MLEVLIALVGTGFGWLLGEFGVILRRRSSDMLISRQVIFNLLEIYHLLQRLDVTRDIALYVDQLLTIVPIHERTPETRRFLVDSLQAILPSLIEKEIAIQLEEVNKKYPETISQLSSIDPVMAFRLSGKTKIMNYFDQLSKFYSTLTDQHPAERTQIDLLGSQINNHFKPEIITASIAAIKIDILELANNTDRRTKKRLISFFENEVCYPDQEEIEKNIKPLKPLFNK